MMGRVPVLTFAAGPSTQQIQCTHPYKETEQCMHWGEGKIDDVTLHAKKIQTKNIYILNCASKFNFDCIDPTWLSLQKFYIFIFTKLE